MAEYGGRPPVITDDMPHTVPRRRAKGESVEDIRRDLTSRPANAGEEPQHRQHLPGPGRARETAGSPRGRALADATGMPISGTRSSYTVEEIAAVARRIGRQPRFCAEDTSTD
ncbi:hypothetical protein [Streptomyces javensis]|uniref:Uncharacterized protein n=1 Tax=Streptomyces javensis TaxID=114698 RepID=A0ABP4HUU1_9ACTN